MSTICFEILQLVLISFRIYENKRCLFWLQGEQKQMNMEEAQEAWVRG